MCYHRGMTLSDLTPHADVVAQMMATDPAYRALRQRNTLANQVALALVRYRSTHSLSQRALAAQLGWHQPQVARLETGESTPTIETLAHLAATLGMSFSLTVSPAGHARDGALPEGENVFAEAVTHDGVRVGACAQIHAPDVRGAGRRIAKERRAALDRLA